MNVGHVRVVARQELLDLFRNRQVWLSLLLQPILFFALLVGISYFANERGNAFRTREFKAVVAGDQHDTRTFEDMLRRAHFRPIRSDDVEGPIVGGDAEVGITVPKGAGKALSSGTRVHLDLTYLANRDSSEVAMARLRVALDAYSRRLIRQRLETHALPTSVAEPLTTSTTSASSTDLGARLALAALLPGLLLFQSTALMTTASQRLAGRKERRTLEPLLVLPIDRSDILVGAGVAAFVIGVIPPIAFIAPLMGITSLPISFAEGLTSPWGVGSTLLLTGPLVASLMVAIGLMVGALTRSSESSSTVSSLAFVPVFAMGMLLMTVDSLPTSLQYFAIPVYGVALFARQAIVHGISLLPLVIAATTTPLYAGLLLRLASRSLKSERSVLRASA